MCNGQVQTAVPITRAREVPFLGHSWTVIYHTPAAWGIAFAFAAFN